MSAIGIRPAHSGDADEIARIYNQGIEERVATLETEPRPGEERRAWLAARGPRHPVIVAEREGRIVGWGSLNPFNPRACYDHVADFSVYVDRDARGSGVGRRMLEHLVELAKAIGYHKLVLAALRSNDAGTALYTRLGFRQVGIYREHGLLDGRWVDVLLMERLLVEPQPEEERPTQG
jgi:phosphinothricin acetyltransferase